MLDLTIVSDGDNGVRDNSEVRGSRDARCLPGTGRENKISTPSDQS